MNLSRLYLGAAFALLPLTALAQTPAKSCCADKPATTVKACDKQAGKSCCKAKADTAATKGCCKTQAQKACCNEVIRTIMARRSVRKYLAKPVEHAKLELIARCGVNAPNGMNAQPWQVRIVESQEWIDGITREFLKKNPQATQRDANFKNMFRNAPNVIVIATPEGKGLIDAGLMGENMILAAQSLGLGTCCLGGPVGFVQSDPAAKPYLDRLALPEGYTIAYMIAVGYPDESPEAKPRDMEKVQFVK